MEGALLTPIGGPPCGGRGASFGSILSFSTLWVVYLGDLNVCGGRVSGEPVNCWFSLVSYLL